MLLMALTVSSSAIAAVAQRGGNVAPVRVLQDSNVSPYLVGTPFGVPAAAPNVIFHAGFQPQ